MRTVVSIAIGQQGGKSHSSLRSVQSAHSSSNDMRSITALSSSRSPRMNWPTMQAGRGGTAGGRQVSWPADSAPCSESCPAMMYRKPVTGLPVGSKAFQPGCRSLAVPMPPPP